MGRFWDKVQKTDACWLWSGTLDLDGYGQLSVAAWPIKAHRISWVWHFGAIRGDKSVLHTCDVRNCVRPAHLFLGNQATNMKDAARKGRLNVGRPNRRRLSNLVIQNILTEPNYRGVVTDLAREYRVSKTYVSLLRRGLRRRILAKGEAA